MSRVETWVRSQGPWQRILVFLVVLALPWLPGFVLLSWLGNAFNISGATGILSLVLLYAGFLWGLPRWGQRIHHWRKPFRHCGLIFQAQTVRDLAIALVIGVMGVFALFGLETLLGWASPTQPSPLLYRFVVEGLAMALSVGFAEEMLFRGWVLAELEKNYSSTPSLIMSALFFAGTHFIKPWAEIVRTFPQFFGLLALGLALVWARRTQTPTLGRSPIRNLPAQGATRIGYPIGLHAGLIWGYYIVNVGGLSQYTGLVPEWVTGIDSNPLAGALGIILLGLIAAQFAKIAQPKA
ncbi:MAG: CPBP family intramembrane metalloprotease [Phormidesmis sp. RL_2_1]|nr:CPBP family intramembrane metalloprotease [Phormidesmis sp. RL_2_1]